MTRRTSRNPAFSNLLPAALVLALMATLLGDPAAAQLREMVIDTVQPPDRGVPVFREYPDEAVLFFTSSLPNLRFDSNMGGIVADRSEPDQGIYRLVVKPYTQIFTITAPGFIQAKLRVAGLQPRQWKYYSVQPKDPDVGRLPVNFQIEPDGASLFVSDTQEDPSRPVQLAEGRHPVRIELMGHRTRTDTIEVSRENTLFEYQLELVEEVVVRFRSVPTGATLYLDNIREGITDMDNFYYPGQYLARVTLDGYNVSERLITVEEEGENLFEFELEKFASTLRLDLTPDDARVLIDGRDIGSQRVLDLRPGITRISADREGYQAYNEQLTLQTGQSLDLDITLKPITGTLLYRVSPVEASAYLVDDQAVVIRQWIGTQRLDDVPVGVYSLVSKRSGHTTQVVPITVAENETLPLSVELQQGPVGTAEQELLLQLTAQRESQSGVDAAPTGAAARTSDANLEVSESGSTRPAGQSATDTVQVRADSPTRAGGAPPQPAPAPSDTPAPTANESGSQAAQSPARSSQSASSSVSSDKPTRSSSYGALYFGTSLNETYLYGTETPPVYDGNQSIHAGLMVMGRFFLLDLRAGYSRLMLSDNVDGRIDDPYVEEVFGWIGIGGHILLGPLDLYGMAGITASEFSHDPEWNASSYTRNDVYYELGAHLFLGRTFGLKYGYRQSFDSGMTDFNNLLWHDASIIFRF